ncbi:tandem-95 repeat protein, partial [Aliikangiella coralliicola]
NTIIPDANFNGSLIVPVVVGDGFANSDIFNATVTVNAVNDKPVINSHTIPAVNEDSSLTIQLSHLDISDVDSNSFTVTVHDGANYSKVGNTITPEANFNGTITIPVTVNDGSASSDALNASVTVNAINDAPVIAEGAAQTIATDQDNAQSFTLNASDVDNSTLTWSEYTSPSHGSVSGYGAGLQKSLTYTPASGFHGTDSFVVQVSDGIAVDRVTVSVQVNQVNQEFAEKFSGIVSDAALVTPSVPANQAVGAVEGQAGVSGGAATYSVPIAIPPGRNGMQPNVSLSYSSKSGNGKVGMGWSLSAGSSIHRCGQIAAIDTYGLGVTYNAGTDKLCLDGQRLIVVEGNYGESGAIYRTELDSFVKVTQFNGINNGTSQFRVDTKGGRKLYYGWEADARHSASGRSEILSWAIKREEDQHQNAIVYQYTTYGAGEHLLTAIDYTEKLNEAADRKVEFIYPDTERSDKSVRYLAGGKTEQTRLLESIKTSYNDTVVRQYNLAYQTSSLSERAILKSIEECAFKDSIETCLPKTDLTSYAPALGWNSVSSNNANDSQIPGFGQIDNYDQIRMKDLNGDGVAEILYLDREQQSPGVYGHDIRVYQLDANGQYQKVAEVTDDVMAPQIYGGIEGDINGDGIRDFIAAESNRRLVYLQFEQDFTLTKHPTSFYLTDDYDLLHAGAGAQLIDMDADGYQDIVFTSLGINGQIQVAYYRNKATGAIDFNGPYTMYNLTRGGQWSADQTASLMDMDGDGLLDIVLSHQKGFDLPQSAGVLEASIAFASRNASGVIQVSERDATQLGLPTNHHLNQYNWADLNGDGLKDFVRAVKTGNSFDWKVRLNQGNRTFAAEQSLGTSLGLHQWPLVKNDVGPYKVQARFGGMRVADVDGDGADEVLVATGTSDTACFHATGFNWDPDSRMLAVESCNDAIRLPEHENIENPGEMLSESLGIFDARRFHWSVLDFKVDSSSQVKHSRTTSNVAYAPIAGLGYLDGALSTPLQLTDYNNDGHLDLFFRTLSGHNYNGGFTFGGQVIPNGGRSLVFTGTNKPATGFFVQANSGVHSTRQPDTLYEVKDGLDKKSRWDYAPISRAENVNGTRLYTVPENREDWYTTKDSKREHFYFTSSMPVVSSFYQSNGVGSENETTYRYKEAVYNRMGRGFQGFRTIIVDSPAQLNTSDEVSDKTRAVTDFHQIFPKAGKIEEVRTCLASDGIETCSPTTPLSYTKNIYFEKKTAESSDSNSEDVYWVVPYSTVTKTYALDSRTKQYSKSTTIINAGDVDNYGNVEKSTHWLENGFSKVETQTVSTFTNDADNWWIGKLIGSKVTTKTVFNTSKAYDSLLDPVKQIQTTYTWTENRQPDVITTDVLQGDGQSMVVDTDYNPYGLPTSVKTYPKGDVNNFREVTTT